MKEENKLILCGFLDLFSVSAFITTLPSHIKSFDVSTAFIGLFFSLYGALQIISSYLMGYLADTSDKKYVLCTCTALTSIGYLVLGMAPSFRWIFGLRIITGLFKQTQTLSRTMLSTADGSNDVKVTMLGRFSALSSVGFIFGPPIGGYIHEKYGFFYVGCLSSIGFFIMLVIFLTLESPGTTKRKLSDTRLERSRFIRNTTDGSDGKVEDDTLSLILKTWDIQASIFLLSLCPLLFRTNYSLTLKELFQSSGVVSGFATSFGAVTGSVAGIVVPYVIVFYRRHYEDDNTNHQSTYAETMLLFHTSLILGLSILSCGLAPTLAVFVLAQSPVSFVNNLSREGFNVVISNRVLKNQVGRVMGMNGSLIAFARLVAPVIGGVMQEFSYRMPAYCGALCSFFAAGIVYCFIFGRLSPSHIK